MTVDNIRPRMEINRRTFDIMDTTLAHLKTSGDCSSKTIKKLYVFIFIMKNAILNGEDRIDRCVLHPSNFYLRRYQHDEEIEKILDERFADRRGYGKTY